MPLVNLSQLRRALAVRGLTVASVVPEASGGRREEACIRPARLVESPELAWHDPGPPEAWPGTLAFLDGVDRKIGAAERTRKVGKMVVTHGGEN